MAHKTTLVVFEQQDRRTPLIFIFMFKTTGTNVTTFNSAQFGDLRTHQSESGNVWFCLNDVMKSLGLSHITELKKRLQEKGCSSIAVLTNGGNQQMIFIDEPNLYRCIFQSRKAEAEQFQNWVFEEVLPTLRKTGRYEVKSSRRALPREKSSEMAGFFNELTRWTTTANEKTVAEMMNVTPKHVHEVVRGRTQSYGVCCMLVEFAKENRSKGVRRQPRALSREADMKKLRLEFMEDSNGKEGK